MDAKEVTVEPAEETPVIRKRIGNTTYLVKLHFSETANETFEDKIRRLLRKEVEKL